MEPHSPRLAFSYVCEAQPPPMAFEVVPLQLTDTLRNDYKRADRKSVEKKETRELIRTGNVHASRALLFIVKSMARIKAIATTLIKFDASSHHHPNLGNIFLNHEGRRWFEPGLNAKLLLVIISFSLISTYASERHFHTACLEASSWRGALRYRWVYIGYRRRYEYVRSALSRMVTTAWWVALKMETR
jgi:hypothetical protein